MKVLERFKEIKYQQWRNLGFIVLGLVVAVTIVIALGRDKPKPKKLDTKPHFVSPLKTIDDSRYWRERTEEHLASTIQKAESLQVKLKKLESERTRDKVQSRQQRQSMEELRQELARLKRQMASKPKQVVYQKKLASSLTQRQTQAPNQPRGRMFPGAPGSKVQTQQNLITPHIRQDKVLVIKPKLQRSDKNYVSAGSFVKAILLSGLDAASGVTNQGSPRPVLLRLLNPGTLPNAGKSKLQDCLVTAAGIGDISSERAYIRLERMSCKSVDGALTDYPVFGSVIGPDGKDGVRGIPVWREGALLQRAALAGSFSGLAGGISQGYTTSSISALGNTSGVKAGSLLKYGAASGASSALEKLADYHIKRAEQYQPIIQVSAGTQVDILFLKGFYLDGQKHNAPQVTEESLS